MSLENHWWKMENPSKIRPAKVVKMRRPRFFSVSEEVKCPGHPEHGVFEKLDDPEPSTNEQEKTYILYSPAPMGFFVKRTQIVQN